MTKCQETKEPTERVSHATYWLADRSPKGVAAVGRVVRRGRMYRDQAVAGRAGSRYVAPYGEHSAGALGFLFFVAVMNA